MKKQTLLIVILLLFALGLGISIYYLNDKDNNDIDYKLNEVKNESNNKGDINKFAKVEDIVFEEDKINVYMFWGSTCPHCKEEFAFFQSIYDEYGEYFNLYGFEVWNNEENHELMEKMAEEMNDNISGVPYTIIGKDSFTGFTDADKSGIIEMLKKESNLTYDAYKEIKE